MTDHEHDNENGKDEGEYPNATHLYIRTNPADDGSEPLAVGLAFWQSPDIVIVQPGGARGTEAIADAVNQVEVTVTNGGGIPAVDAYVDVFFGNPATTMTPTTTTLIGGGYTTIPPINTATISFPWTPGQGDAGHRCLLARVSLIIPPDTYVNGTIFDVVNDRHVAQRNIHVLAVEKNEKSASFSFMIANPSQERAGAFAIRATQVRPGETGDHLTHTLGCAVPPRLAEGRLAGVSMEVHDAGFGDRPTLMPRAARALGPLLRPLRPTGRDRAEVRLDAGEVREATVTLERDPDARPGEISAVDIVQIDEEAGTAVGGLTVVLHYR